jgi:hypothetical protein
MDITPHGGSATNCSREYYRKYPENVKVRIIDPIGYWAIGYWAIGYWARGYSAI